MGGRRRSSDREQCDCRDHDYLARKRENGRRSGYVVAKKRDPTAQPGKVWFGDIWRASGWNEESSVVHVELRSEREALIAFKCEGDAYAIETMEDLFERLRQYGTQLWLRHIQPQRHHQRTKWPTTPWWKVVQGVTFHQPDALPVLLS